MCAVVQDGSEAAYQGGPVLGRQAEAGGGEVAGDGVDQLGVPGVPEPVVLQVGAQPVRGAGCVLGAHQAVDRAAGGFEQVAQEVGAEEAGGAGQQGAGGRPGGAAGGCGDRGVPAGAGDVRGEADLGGEVRSRGGLRRALFSGRASQEAVHPFDRGCREQGAQGGASAAALLDPLGEGHREQGVAAQGEEVVADADPGHAEGLRERLAQGPLAVRARGAAAGRRGPVGGGQGPPVGLAVGGQRQRVEAYEGGGDHVGGQGGGEVGAQLGRVRSGRAVGRDGVRDEAPVAGPVLADDGAGRRHAGQGGEHGLDLAGFDAEAAELDLVVHAGDVDEFTVPAARSAAGGPADQVAGAVHPAPAGRPGRPRSGSR